MRCDVNHCDINYLNDSVCRECGDQQDFLFVDANCWLPPKGFGNDGLHLNNFGNKCFSNLLRRAILSLLSQSSKNGI